MIKTTLGILHEAVPAITALMLEKLPIKQAYHTSKLAKKIQHELETYVEQRDVLLKEYGTEDEKNPGTYSILPKDQVEWGKKMKELSELPVEIELDPIKLVEVEAANLTSQHAFYMMEAGVLIE